MHFRDAIIDVCTKRAYDTKGDTMNLNEIRTQILTWAATHTDVTVEIADEAMNDNAIQVSVNDPENEYAWVGFEINESLTILATDQSDDMDEDDADSLNASADDLIATLKAAK